jgi:guanine nucleotide-binding protein G(i) subunit alpha
VFARRNEFEIPPNTEYGVDMVDKLADPKTLFNYEDVHIYLRGREKTMQVSETEFKVGIFSWHLVESGPEHENKKMWPTVFKGVIAMVFVAALDDWDIINSEDPKMRTRMQISLDLFEGMVNHELFKDRPWVLLLNKRDLLKNKLQEHDLAKTFPEYKGGDDFDAAVDFIKSQYLARIHKDPKELDSHMLCALETEETNSVFEEALEFVFKKCSDL